MPLFDSFLKPKVADKLLEEYSNAVALGGPESPKAKAIREANSMNPEFAKYAAAIDKLKRAVSGRTTQGKTQKYSYSSPKPVAPAS